MTTCTDTRHYDTKSTQKRSRDESWDEEFISPASCPNINAENLCTQLRKRIRREQKHEFNKIQNENTRREEMIAMKKTTSQTHFSHTPDKATYTEEQVHEIIAEREQVIIQRYNTLIQNLEQFIETYVKGKFNTNECSYIV